MILYHKYSSIGSMTVLCSHSLILIGFLSYLANFWGDHSSWGPNFLGAKFPGDQISWGPNFLGTKFLGDQISRGPNFLGTKKVWGPNFWGPNFSGPKFLGDQKIQGTKWVWGPTQLQPFKHPVHLFILILKFEPIWYGRPCTHVMA